MSDLWTMGSSARSEAATDRDEAPASRSSRRISRTRSLPGSRAVVGALLVTAAAVGVFSAYLNATAEPATSYVVALGDIPIGTVLTEEVLTDPTQFGLAAVELPAETARGAVPADQALGLAGQVTAAPFGAGDLVTRTGLLDADLTDGTARLSFPIPANRAVAGSLDVGDRIDVVATFGSGGDVVTEHVVRDVQVVALSSVGDGFAGSSELVITLALPEGEAVLDVAQAIDVADVFVVRTPLGASEVSPPSADDEEVTPPTDVEAEPEAEPDPAPTDDADDADEDGDGDADDDADDEDEG